MAMTRYVEERKFYGEDTADLYDYKSNPRTKTVELFRLFKESRPNLRASALEMMDKFTSAANEDSIEADTAIDYVDNPKVSQGKSFFSGRWRLISNKEFRDPTDSNIQGILQHLKLYWNTTVLADSGAIDWTRARVVSYESSPGNSEAFNGSTSTSADPTKLAVIEWAAVAPAKVAAVVAEFAAHFPASAFTVDGQEFPAGWSYVFAAVKDDDTDLDGTKTVRFVVGRPEFVLKYQGQLLSSKAYTGYMIWDLPQSLAQTLINTVKAAHPQGISIYPDYDKAAHTCSIRLRVRDSLAGSSMSFAGGATCMQTDSLSLYRGYTESALQSLLSALASSVIAGTWYDISVTEDEEDGLFDAVVTKHVATEVTIGPVVTETSSAASTVTTKVYNTTTTPELVETGGLIQRAQWTKNANCTQDTAVEVTTVNDQTANSYEKTAARSEVSELHTQSAHAASSPPRSAGKTVRVENTPTEAGRYRTVESVTTYEDQTTTSHEKSAAQLAATVLHTQATNQDNTSHSGAGAGTIVRTENRPTESGKYHVTVETIRCTNQTSVSTDVSSAATATKTLKTQNDALSSPGAATPGTIYRQDSAPTEFGKYRTVEEVVVVADQVAVSTDSSPAFTATRTVHTENAETLSPPSIVQGTITRQEATPTEAGRERTVETVYVPTDQTSTGGESSAAVETVAVTHTELADQPVIGAGGDGVIYHLESRPTEAGNYHTVETAVTVKDQTATGSEASAAQTSTTEHHTQNVVVPTAESSNGVIQRVSAQPTEAGRYRTSLEVITAVNQTATGGEDSLAKGVSVVLNTQTMQPGAISAAPGTVKRVSVHPTSFGKYEVSEEVVTPKSRTVTEGAIDAFQSVLETTNTHTVTAIAPAPPTFSSGTRVTVVNRPTEAGFETKSAVVTAIARNHTHISAVADQYSEVTEWQKNADTLPDAVAASDASVQVDGHMNDFGKYDYVKVTRTANAPLSCPNPVSYETKGPRYFAPVTTYPGGKVYQASYISALVECYDTETHTISFHTTASAAATAMTGGDSGSSISRVGDNLWSAHKITHIVTAVTTLNFAAPRSTYTATRAIYDEA